MKHTHAHKNRKNGVYAVNCDSDISHQIQSTGLPIGDYVYLIRLPMVSFTTTDSKIEIIEDKTTTKTKGDGERYKAEE